ncbi:MAG: helix-turn-helix domain-containing protein [Acidobacteriota bacterium]|nr:helix-turn-helix domain-containing protein [Acidobacteriota bacterium]MDH3785388.1 helix-turn-helix domain-containing protein [Acidobacteriota bacterium]
MASTAQANLKGSARLGSYLKKLRTGYGYSLRGVEERARADGGEIDNSQLSRYEKGICYPSFDKLRVLANVFNVSIQSFSDVVDLETLENIKPALGAPEDLIEEGVAALKSGDHGAAFALFERSIEILEEEPPDAERLAMIGRARVNQAAALARLGKLALAEQELRNALRRAETLEPRLRTRALLALANIHADQGDGFLAEMEADKAHTLATESGLDRLAAMARHIAARVLGELGQSMAAIERYRESAQLYAACGEQFEAIRVRMNIGSHYVKLGKLREGIRMLREALNEAREGGHRRLEAYAWSKIGQSYYTLEDLRRARSCFRESDALAIYNGEKQSDILFLNSFYEWQIAARDNNPTREKIAFGRLKVLRSSLERRFPEVDQFDDYVERGRNHA